MTVRPKAGRRSTPESRRSSSGLKRTSSHLVPGDLLVEVQPEVALATEVGGEVAEEELSEEVVTLAEPRLDFRDKVNEYLDIFFFQIKSFRIEI